MINPTIGILGGMGPRATVVFQDRLFNAFEGSDQDMPRIICVNDGSTPDRTNFLISNGEDPLLALINSANILTNAGADIICLPCNTAHAGQILGRLQGRIALPVIDMPAAALAQAEDLQIKKLLVLATRGTRLSQVYQSRSSGIVCKFPDEVGQNMVDDAIQLIKCGQLEKVNVGSLAKIVESAGCGATVLACTELSLLQQQLTTSDIIIIDAMDCLVNRCIEHVSSYNMRKGVIV